MISLTSYQSVLGYMGTNIRKKNGMAKFFRNILLFALKKHYIFYMRRVWEHVHGLYSNYAILYV